MYVARKREIHISLFYALGNAVCIDLSFAVRHRRDLKKAVVSVSSYVHAAAAVQSACLIQLKTSELERRAHIILIMMIFCFRQHDFSPLFHIYDNTRSTECQEIFLFDPKK